MPRTAPPDVPAKVPAKRRPGRPEAAPEVRRSVTMGVRVSAAERARLEAKAAAVGVPVTAFLRLAADGVVPRVVPEGNRAQWLELAHLARTLGRMERALAGLRTPLMPAEVLVQLDAFRPVVCALAGDVHAVRNALLGRDPAGRAPRYEDDSPDEPEEAPDSTPDVASEREGSASDVGAREDAHGAGIRADSPPVDGELRNSAVPTGALASSPVVPSDVPSDGADWSRSDLAPSA